MRIHAGIQEHLGLQGPDPPVSKLIALVSLFHNVLILKMVSRLNEMYHSLIVCPKMQCVGGQEHADICQKHQPFHSYLYPCRHGTAPVEA